VGGKFWEYDGLKDVKLQSYDKDKNNQIVSTVWLIPKK